MVPRSSLKPGLIALVFAGTWAPAMDRVPGTLPGLPAPVNGTLEAVPALLALARRADAPSGDPGEPVFLPLASAH